MLHNLFFILHLNCNSVCFFASTANFCRIVRELLVTISLRKPFLRESGKKVSKMQELAIYQKNIFLGHFQSIIPYNCNNVSFN